MRHNRPLRAIVTARKPAHPNECFSGGYGFVFFRGAHRTRLM